MTSMDYVDIDIDDNSISYNMQMNPGENVALVNEFAQLNVGASSKEADAHMAINCLPVKKSRAEKRSVKEDRADIAVGDVIKLYAYKDCLGKYDSLIRNPDMPLWYRDVGNLLQKLVRIRCDDDGLFYSSTIVFSCWEKRRAKEYVELQAEIVMKTDFMNYMVKILDIRTVENICSNGNFKELGLEPYISFEQRAKLQNQIVQQVMSTDTSDDSISSDDQIM